MRIIFIMMLMLLTGCAGIGGLAPSGVMDYSCEPNCKAKDYYIPGKGVWAKKKTIPIAPPNLGPKLRLIRKYAPPPSTRVLVAMADSEKLVNNVITLEIATINSA